MIAWGNNSNGQTNVPASATNVVAIAAGGAHALAVEQNGTVVAWGSNGAGETNVPTNLTNAMSVAAGYAHSLALRNDGAVIGWGDNTYGQTNVGGGLTPIKSIASGGNHSLAVVFSSLVQYPVDVSKDLLLIYNTNSADSLVVKDYYLAHRPMVSGANVLGIGCVTNDTALFDEFTNQIAAPILQWLTNNPTKHPQYVILFLNIPNRVHTNVDSFLPPLHPSVSVSLHDLYPGTKPFITHINMNGTNDCIGYINKLASFGTNLVLSASAAEYANTNYYFDDMNLIGNGPFLTNGVTGVMASGTSASAITYVATNASYSQHVFFGTNVAGYTSWGTHGGFPTNFTSNGTVKFYGNSGWYIMQTVESFNGQGHNPVNDQSTFLFWFAQNAFSGTNYSATPIGAVSHVDEPSLVGVNLPYYYFGLWERGKNFAFCAWNSRTLASSYLQAVGDPFVKR